MLKTRSRRRLDKMHVWVHRRFHSVDMDGPNATRYWRYWLDVRSKIWELMLQKGNH